MEVGLSGMSGLTFLRSQSLFSLSDVKCYFAWGTDYWADRQEVINRMTTWIQLPNGLTSQISPWNAIGEVFRYTLEGEGYTLTDKKTAEDWIMERQWRQVQGVIDVTSYGGTTKQYHVDVDPYRLRGHGVTLTQTITALQNANQNVGGQRMTIGEQSYDVRGLGLLGYFGTPLTDINDVVISQGPQVNGLNTGTPVRVRDVADVAVGYAPRLGMVGHDDEDDVVQGIVLMKYAGQANPTLAGIKEKVKFIEENNLLPPGMKLVPYYDRGQLTKLTIHTVLENVLIGMGLVVLVLVLFLSDVRAAIITAINIPLALTVAIVALVTTRQSANLLSLGAVDFGIVVDSTIIMIGEHIPASRSQWKRNDDGARARGGARGRHADDVLDGHHRSRLLAAVHAGRRAWGHLRSNGADLRDGDHRGHPVRPDADARPRREVSSRAARGEGELHHALPSQGL